jgi:hypothetical protein
MKQPTFRTIPKPAPTLIESIRDIQAQVTDLEASMTELLNQTVKRVVDLEMVIVELEERAELVETAAEQELN